MPTALIVDDEPEANTLMAMLVQLRGYRTVSALTGREALEAVGRESFDVVFLDLMLPDINGFEVCRQIKGHAATALTPVVIVTARVATENRATSFRHGADGFVPKPYTPDDLFEALDQAAQVRVATSAESVAGRLALLVDDEDETLRRLARLRNLIVATTSLPPDTASALLAIVGNLVGEARSWAGGRVLTEAAVLDYQTHADRLELTVRDEHGWLARWLEQAGGPAALEAALAGLTVEPLEEGSAFPSLRLVQRIPTGS